MNTKTVIVISIGAGLFLMLVSFLLGWNLKPEKVCPIIQDSIFVQGDTVWLPSDTTWLWKEKKPALKDSVVDERYYELFDSSFVHNKDTIDVKAEVGFSSVKKEFDFNMEIKHKDYQFQRVDTLKLNIVEIKEITVNNPWLITITLISVILLILSLTLN